MPKQPRNLDWLRGLKADNLPADFGARLHEMMSDFNRNDETLERQTNSNLAGNIAPPPLPNSLKVVPHPQGVQFSIQHDAEFYADPHYEIDYTAGNITHTVAVGTSRNGVLPVGGLTAAYQVRTKYANGASSSPVVAGTVTGGTGVHALLPSQAAGTTRANQPPGAGGPYRGNKPPVRNK